MNEKIKKRCYLIFIYLAPDLRLGSKYMTHLSQFWEQKDGIFIDQMKHCHFEIETMNKMHFATVQLHLFSCGSRQKPFDTVRVNIQTVMF